MTFKSVILSEAERFVNTNRSAQSKDPAPSNPCTETTMSDMIDLTPSAWEYEAVPLRGLAKGSFNASESVYVARTLPQLSTSSMTLRPS